MPKDPHINGGIRYDWTAIKHEYVTDPKASLRKLSEKYGVSYTTIAKKSKADNWFATRKECLSDIVSKSISLTTDRLARELTKESDFLTLIKGHVDRMLKDEQQFNRHLVQGGMDDQFETKEIVAQKVDSRALKDTMQVLKMMEEMTRSLYNLQKAETIQKHQIEAARLELERERFEFEKQKAEFSRPDNTNTIRIDGIEKEWSE